MESVSGETRSVWMETAEVPGAPALSADARADVCVIGAGIAGLSTAYMLAREGKAVIVLDHQRVGGGMTERTTAHLSNAIDDRYVEIERLHGADGARIAAQSHTAAIDRIEAIVAAERIHCDFERLDGYLFVPPSDSVELLEQELEAARRAGLADVALVDRAPLETFDTGKCLRFPRQAQFHPLRYLIALGAAIERCGGRIFSGTHVTSVDGGDPVRVATAHGEVVTAAAAVVATNAPIGDRVAIHTKQAPYTTYVIGASVPAGSVTRALYWDTADPYHYIRLQRGDRDSHELLIVGGEDHKSGQADDGVQRLLALERWTKQRFPLLERIEFRWSGQVMESADGLAFIGRDPTGRGNIYVATGDSGMGMTHGTIAGILITDSIMGRDSPWRELYEPSRKMLRAPIEYSKENLNVAAQYFEDYFTGGEVSSTDDIGPGQGAVVRRGLTKIAAFRDDHGILHERSAVCPHLGCIVSWNLIEKTWDCPCHGSRFDRYGEALVGPASRGLKRLETRRYA